jgi:cytochrome c-type biogenesis protein CcmE
MMTDMSIASQAEARPGPARNKAKQTKFLVGGLVVVLVIGYLIVSSMGGATQYYLTVAELETQGPSNRIVRVNGLVDGDSIQYDARSLRLQFDLVDESGRLSVVHYDVLPDMLRDGADAVVEGKFRDGGVFEVNPNGLLLKCPSKYEEAATATAQP